MPQSMAWRMGRAIAWTLPRIAPVAPTIVFGSDQPDDPDALVILDHLAEHSDRAVSWTAPTIPAVPLLGSDARRRVVTRRERTAGALRAYARAGLVFHTAGLYTSPEPARGRTVVTVWHGDGPKSTQPPAVRGTYMVAGVERFGRRRIAVHGYAPDELLVTGRPRVDDLFRAESEPVPDQVRHRIGLDDRPTVWWLPTWRQGATGGAASLPQEAQTAARIDGLEAWQFVVKPHRLAPAQAWPEGWHVVTDADLRRAGVRLYRLLGSAHAVLTDYSSVWSDLMGTSIPVAFILGDLAQYTRARGFYDDDWRERLPGPILEVRDDLARFLADGWTPALERRRRDLCEELGVNNSPGATARLFAALDQREVAWS